ncbi:hypothetical protein [Sphingomonas sp. CROZ-RG-20F-R02-07]|uniref:DUF7697 family protein n=1 Tax=Sphingomonas sp. CROZ-RG-20F-R02-07 TaxID=2914832 RepID=UPI001F59193E|nr:hypothetical protein [Sphingomonas sp. CROZ-RG-20F-R02-07]
MIASCGSQLRYATISLGPAGSITQPVGLDYGVVLQMADALEADRQLVARVLPAVEAAILDGIIAEPEAPEEEE